MSALANLIKYVRNFITLMQKSEKTQCCHKAVLLTNWPKTSRDFKVTVWLHFEENQPDLSKRMFSNVRHHPSVHSSHACCAGSLAAAACHSTLWGEFTLHRSAVCLS